MSRAALAQVINLAAICNPSEYIKQPVNTINSNFTDAQDCINFCVEYGKHLIHFSTCEVYGRTLSSYGLPADDPKNFLLDEETTPMIMGPVSAQRWCYACAKQLVERLIYAHGTENNLKFTIIRPYNWIGPRMDYIPGVDGKDDGQPRVLASFMTALMKGEPLVLVNGGEVFRTFCFVEDAIDAVVRCVENPDKSCGYTFNVGNPDNNIKISELAELMINMYHNITGARRARRAPPAAQLPRPGLPPTARLCVRRQGEGHDEVDLRRGVLRQGVRGLGPAHPEHEARQAADRLGAQDLARLGDGEHDEGVHRELRRQARQPQADGRRPRREEGQEVSSRRSRARQPAAPAAPPTARPRERRPPVRHQVAVGLLAHPYVSSTVQTQVLPRAIARSQVTPTPLHALI